MTEDQLEGLQNIKSFSVDLHPEPLAFEDELKSVPAHESVLRPLLRLASECQVFGLKEESPIFDVARPILLRRSRNIWELDLRTELIKGFERFWNAGTFRRGSVVFAAPYSMKRFGEIFAHCSVPLVWSGVSQLRKAHPNSAVKHCYAVQERGDTAFALSASNGIQWMDVFPPREHLEELFSLAARVGDREMRKPAWIWQ